MMLSSDMDHALQIIENALGVPSDRIHRILLEPTLDAEGKGALSVTVVFEDGKITGVDAVAIYSEVQNALMGAGDPRFPIIDFATEDELAFNGDTEL